MSPVAMLKHAPCQGQRTCPFDNTPDMMGNDNNFNFMILHSIKNVKIIAENITHLWPAVLRSVDTCGPWLRTPHAVWSTKLCHFPSQPLASCQTHKNKKVCVCNHNYFMIKSFVETHKRPLRQVKNNVEEKCHYVTKQAKQLLQFSS